MVFEWFTKWKIQIKFNSNLKIQLPLRIYNNLLGIYLIDLIDLAIAFAAICKNKVGHQKYDR